MSDLATPNLSYTGRLRRHITELFDLGEIKTLCFDLNIDYDMLKGENKGEKVRELVKEAQRRDRLSALIALCREAFPNETWEDPPTAHSTLSLVLPQGQDGESVERGLEALTELMQFPEARTAVIAFRTDFQAVNDQIDLVGNYKEVHDMLHTLELQCFNALRQAARLFPDDELTIDTLMETEITLQQIIALLKDLEQRPTFGDSELIWIKDLDRAQVHLGAALDEEDAGQLKRATWLVNRVVAVQPSQINTRLNAVARSLRLTEIVRAMTSIHEKLAELNLDREKLDQFVAGALSLAKLNANLQELVEGHDNWQAIILELRRIESAIDVDPIELEMSWPDLKEMLETLFEGKEEETWVADLREDGAKLDEAIAAGNPARFKRFFRRIDRRAGDRFYRVDIDLRRLTEDLRRVGQPLATILEILE